MITGHPNVLPGPPKSVPGGTFSSLGRSESLEFLWINKHFRKMVKTGQNSSDFVGILSILSPQGLPQQAPKAYYPYGFHKMPLFDQNSH